MLEPGMDITRGCWVDLFDSPHFAGNVRRVFGPAIYLDIRLKDADYPVEVVSLIIGPHAYVHFFSRHRPERGGVWVVPNDRITDLAQAKIEQELDSIRVLNRPPLAYEPGYSAFVRQNGRPHAESSRHRKRRGTRRSS